MKKNVEENLEDIIRYYGSLEDYNEEQRRCAMATIDSAIQANPFTRRVSINNAFPLEVREVKQPRRHFWFKLFGLKA